MKGGPVAISARICLVGISVSGFACAPGLEPANGSDADVVQSPVRLVDQLPADVRDRPLEATADERIEWRFEAGDGSAGAWTIGRGVEAVELAKGRLVGNTTSDKPILSFRRLNMTTDDDLVYAVELRLSVSAGERLAVTFPPSSTKPEDWDLSYALPWATETILVPGEMTTYTLRPPYPVELSRAKHLVVRPSDVAGARFEIEWVRVVSRRQHLAGTKTGPSWQGLSEVYHETLVTQAPEAVAFDLRLGEHPRLTLSIGTPDSVRVTFRIEIGSDTDTTLLLEQTLTESRTWQRVSLDLAPFAGQSVRLVLAAEADSPGAFAFWGSPVVRDDRTSEGGAGPQGVILLIADTLRSDHLEAYGYHRETAPVLARLAKEGALFRHAFAQATWTLPSVTSIFTSLYPDSHGVVGLTDRLSSSATTLAETYRDAGYATFGSSSILFVGRYANLHQGFEEFHEPASLARRLTSKTMREQLDKLLPWLEQHRNDRFLVMLHVSDPHNPYEPAPPFNTLWPMSQTVEATHARARELFGDPNTRRAPMPTPHQLREAGIDVDSYIEGEIGWYDGSISGLDDEVGRLLEALKNLDLMQRVVLAVVSDHGEEFAEHGQKGHGQSVYSELTRIPLLIWGPGFIAPGQSFEEPAQAIDLMPTLLALSDVPVPDSAQGRNWAPALAGIAESTVDPRPAFSSKIALAPGETTSDSVVTDGWKLIEHILPGTERSAYELFRYEVDPLDARNVAADHPGQVRRLSELLADWRKIRGTALGTSESATPIDLDTRAIEQLRALGYVR